MSLMRSSSVWLVRSVCWGGCGYQASEDEEAFAVMEWLLGSKNRRKNKKKTAGSAGG